MTRARRKPVTRKGPRVSEPWTWLAGLFASFGVLMVGFILRGLNERIRGLEDQDTRVAVLESQGEDITRRLQRIEHKLDKLNGSSS